MAKRSPIYRKAIEWIAYNDDAVETDPEMMVSQLTVILVADTFDVDVDDVIKDVLSVRETMD